MAATYYALYLRAHGFAPDEAAYWVAKRYPSQRERLKQLREKPKEEEAAQRLAS